jgi:hypothetical protein
MDIKLTKRSSLFTKRMNVGLRFLITDKKVEKWANGKNIFFVLAIGRSGTKFLADLLNKAPGTYVAHEPVQRDFRAYQRAFHSEEEAMKYIQGFRKREIYLRCRDKGINTYGEVDSVLRRHGNALREAFPRASFIHLIRDGRDVVRSMISRDTLTPRDPKTKYIYPTSKDLFKDQWPHMSRFERLCWLWAVENGYLRGCIGHKVRFEEVISDYEYFRQEILDPLCLDIPEETWRKAVRLPKNVTKQYGIPHWTTWKASETQTFLRICGREMRANGYKID